MRKDDFVSLFNMLTINEEKLLSLSQETGFIQRVRKIDSLDFLYSLSMETMKGIASYNDIASSIENDNGIAISRQAIWKKVTESCVDYFKVVLASVILAKAKKYYKEGDFINCKFVRILIQDSTIIRLPKRLFEAFSGVSNYWSTVCNARIQGVYDLLSGRFISFTISPYSKNDQASAPDLEIQKGDLTLRDRGYLSADEVKRHLVFGSHCIYRYKTKMKLLDYETERTIDILSILKKEGFLDMSVRLNDKERTAIRLVARPVDKETADYRRMKAKKEMKGHRPSKQFLQLQSWTIFITTIPSEEANFDTLLKIYGLRWRIETIFKSWKSNLHFDNIHNVSKNQLIITLIARMIMILIISQVIYTSCKRLISKHINRDLSLLKLTKYLNRYPIKIVSIMRDLQSSSNTLGQSIKSLGLYCVYERRKRQNFEQTMKSIFS
jgi:hypothetical protein